MSTPRKVPQIGRGPQSFSQRAQSPIQSPMQPPPKAHQEFQAIGIPAPVYSVEQDIQDLAMEIYSQLAIDHIKSNATPDSEMLRFLAKHSHNAALAFFEDQPNGQQ